MRTEGEGGDKGRLWRKGFFSHWPLFIYIARLHFVCWDVFQTKTLKPAVCSAGQERLGRKTDFCPLSQNQRTMSVGNLVCFSLRL